MALHSLRLPPLQPIRNPGVSVIDHTAWTYIATLLTITIIWFAPQNEFKHSEARMTHRPANPQYTIRLSIAPSSMTKGCLSRKPVSRTMAALVMNRTWAEMAMGGYGVLGAATPQSRPAKTAWTRLTGLGKELYGSALYQ